MTKRQFRILIVDDEPMIIKILNRALGSAGYSVTSTENGKAALEAYRGERFDLVISDFNMGAMNGLGLLKALKAHDQSVRVITHAGGLKNEEMAQLREAGVLQIIEKPAESKKILAAVTVALAEPFESQAPLTENIRGNTMALARILFVDDDDAIRKVMPEIGKELGFDIQTSACGKDAIVLFLKNKPDVVISDFHMPGMNGLELLSAIKALEPCAKIIIATSGLGPEERRAILDAGAFNVLQKPMDLDTISRAINAALAE
ncbi:MAG: response regulator [Candidatus Micrarchaeota archaeon]